MPVDTRTLARAAFLLSAGAAVAVLFSIAVSHILLASAVLTLLVARERLRLPPIKLPLALFFLGTVIAVLMSSDPAAGLPQIKKFFVYLVLVVLYTTLRRIDDVRRIILIWGVVAAASGLWSFVQFWQKWSRAIAANADVYRSYVGDRVTGFMSHWMTFSAEQMMAGLLLASLLIFGAIPTRRSWLWIATVIIGASVIIAWTRSVWLASAAATIYLVAVWRPKLLLALPLAAVLMWFVSPISVRERAISIYSPHGEVDSNEHRLVTFRTGLEMIKARPWFGLGPEVVGKEFMKYVPPDIPRPLPEGFYGHLHNVYLQYAAERGIPTLAALLWLLGKILIDFSRAVKRLTPEERLRRGVLHGCIAAILAILIEAFFELNLGDTEVLTMFLAVVAFGYIAAEDRGGTTIHA
jgi:O-antigen ligase